jgi:tetratricopeptide (TPR) repeat protein
VLLAQAWRRLEQGDVNAADAFLQRAASTGYETFELAVGQARVALARAQEALAASHLARALALGPDRGLVLAYLGAGLMESDPQRAAGYLHRARDLGRDAADVNGPLGSLALQRGDAAAAIPLLEKAIGQIPQESIQQARLRLDLGSSLLLTGRAAEAIFHLEAAARLAPGEALIRLNLAAALALEGRKEEARLQLERIGERLADNPVLRRLREELGVAAPGA